MVHIPKLNTLQTENKIPFKVEAPFEPTGDQPQAIEALWLRYMHHSPGKEHCLQQQFFLSHGFRGHLPVFPHKKSHHTDTHLHTGSIRCIPHISEKNVLIL